MSQQNSTTQKCKENKGGRLVGSKNKKNHNAGRKKRQIDGQTLMDFQRSTSRNAGFSCDESPVGVPEAEIPVEEEEISEENTVNVEVGLPSSATADEDMEMETVVTEVEQIQIETIENLDSNEQFDDEVVHELNENEFEEINELASSVAEESITDKYLEKIQQRLRGGNIPKEYLAGVFWVQLKDPAFILENELKRNIAEELYTPRVFLWFPHYLMKVLKCVHPDCKNKIEVKCFKKNPVLDVLSI
ncbi:unnamed protein product [Mucor hiemalis]